MTQRKTGDVTVIGMVSGNHVIEDISINVPYGQTVTIPADKALRSKDLWLALNQKCIMKAPPQPVFNKQPPPAVDPDKKRLEAQIFALTEGMKALKKENQKLREDQSDKLDAIMSALQNGVMVAQPAPSGDQGYRHAPTTSRTQDEAPMVVDGSAPTFLPSQIKPEGAEARIEVQGEEADSKVSSAAEKLRELRKKKG